MKRIGYETPEQYRERYRQKKGKLEAGLRLFVQMAQAWPGVRVVYVYDSVALGDVRPNDNLNVFAVGDLPGNILYRADPLLDAYFRNRRHPNH